MKKITQEELKRQLHYDPETGIFTWKIRKTNVLNIGDVAGSIVPLGYVIIGINYKSYQAHRLVFLYMEGYLPENDVDHIDRNPSNNAWNNLREVGRTCNLRNCRISKNNKSGVTGVYWHKETKLWAAYITNLSKSIFLGRFKNKLDAVKARWDAEVKYGYPACNTTSAAYLYWKEHQVE